MPIHLDHTIVPARDKEASARWFARVFGLEYKGPWGHFAPVKVDDNLSLDFDNREAVEHHHYAFIAGDAEFDAIFKRVLDEGLAYGSGPPQGGLQVNHPHRPQRPPPGGHHPPLRLGQRAGAMVNPYDYEVFGAVRTN